MRKYVIDGELSGTGIRDIVNGGYVELDELALSKGLQLEITSWLEAYAELKFGGYEDKGKLGSLDKKGLQIMKLAQEELSECNVGYHSDALLEYLA